MKNGSEHNLQNPVEKPIRRCSLGGSGKLSYEHLTGANQATHTKAKRVTSLPPHVGPIARPIFHFGTPPLCTNDFENLLCSPVKAFFKRSHL